MSLPLVGTIIGCAIGLAFLLARFAMGAHTDPLVCAILALALVASCAIAYDNRAPRRPRPKPSSDRMAVGE